MEARSRGFRFGALEADGLFSALIAGRLSQRVLQPLPFGFCEDRNE
jgi:hypothetical protein